MQNGEAIPKVVSVSPKAQKISREGRKSTFGCRRAGEPQNVQSQIRHSNSNNSYDGEGQPILPGTHGVMSTLHFENMRDGYETDLLCLCYSGGEGLIFGFAAFAPGWRTTLISPC